MITRVHIFSAVLLGMIAAANIPTHAFAQVSPKARPSAGDVPDATAPTSETRPLARPEGLSNRPVANLSSKAAPLGALPDRAPLANAMAAMRSGDWEAALRIASRAGSVERDVIEWHWLRAGRGDFDTARAFLDRRPDWPGLPFLLEKTEGKVPYRRRVDEVLSFFEAWPPQTGAGLIGLAAAYEESGRADEARDLAVRAWTEHDLSTNDERYLLERYGDTLRAHHTARLDYLLWEGEAAAARRIMPRVSDGWQALAEARLALRARAPGVDTLIERVPASLQGDPGLAYERFSWRLDKGRRDGAREILLELAEAGTDLGRPAAYGNWRRILTRASMRAGDPDLAYRLAAPHGIEPGSTYAYADLEWLAGYLSLTYLNEPARALEHFKNFRIVVDSPISLGRAGYWEGRAHEALGNAEPAALAYAFGAEYQTSFYGLLAAERAGLPMDPALTGQTHRPDWREAEFRDSSVLKAAVLLHEAGEANLAERFLTHLAEGLSEVEAGQLGDFALDLEEPHLALMIAKRAARRGIMIPHAYYPVVDFGLGGLPVPEELALAIARRESEFDPAVKSPAGAIGLMQVMPGTARDVAGELNISYSATRLQNDPVYNARLGVTYLDGLIDRFGPNMVLVAAGYNAGPGRPIAWMRERGDPRTGRIDVVDWIEHIPFRETRNYVMRVMESLPVYRARLSGETTPIRLTEEMTAR
ncbi:MAG: lytic transglycosylase domain-containing protein [Pseudomonadota bacterium]